jgi:hypothetical protein
MPRTLKEKLTFPVGSYSFFFTLFALLGVGGCIIGNSVADSKGALVGVLIGLGVSIIITCFLVIFYHHFLEPGTKEEERALFEAINGAVTGVWVGLALAAFIATESIEDNGIAKALERAADRKPAIFWIMIAAGILIGVVSGYRGVRHALQRVSSQSSAPPGTTGAAPQKG